MRDGKIVAAVTGMDHGHINGMTEGIGEAGAVIKWAYDPDTEKTKTFLDHFQKQARTTSWIKPHLQRWNN